MFLSQKLNACFREVLTMPPDTRNPTAWAMRQGSDKSKRAALISELHSTKTVAPEVLAAALIARKYGLTLPVARVIAALADLGGRLG